MDTEIGVGRDRAPAMLAVSKQCAAAWKRGHDEMVAHHTHVAHYACVRVRARERTHARGGGARGNEPMRGAASCAVPYS
jgi:hypothetical protein